MSLSLRFLGTAASRPTVERNVAALAVMREGETLLFDCGEGTQRQMMRYHVSFAVADVFFTHFHADHVIGIIGLMRTMSLQGRTDRLTLWGPRGATRVLRRAEQFGFDRLGFPVEITEIEPNQPLRRNGYDVIPFEVDHRGSASLGYAIVEETRKGRFNPELAREMGIPEGPLWGEIHRGNVVRLPDGRTVDPSLLVGPTRPGRRIVITGDTRPCASTTEMARDADLLVHDAQYTIDEYPHHVGWGHSAIDHTLAFATLTRVKQLVTFHHDPAHDDDAIDRMTRAATAAPRPFTVTAGAEGAVFEVGGAS